ncbi:hypothetical protein BJ742DRAFT_258329 [Cladochytrium replicatum]|nr:hypothetical protein BJ742DRAFT_258329 [Cladochytrium replicatum]
MSQSVAVVVTIVWLSSVSLMSLWVLFSDCPSRVFRLNLSFRCRGIRPTLAITPSSPTITTQSNFQPLAFLSLFLGLVASILSLIQIVLIWQVFPESFPIPIAVAPAVWDQGAQRAGLTVVEILEQMAAQGTAVAYFFLLMDRYTAFKFFMPGGTNKTVRQWIYIVAFVCVLARIVQWIVVNVIPQKIFEDRCILAIFNMTEVLLFLFNMGLDMMCSFALCRAAFTNVTYLTRGETEAASFADPANDGGSRRPSLAGRVAQLIPGPSIQRTAGGVLSISPPEAVWVPPAMASAILIPAAVGDRARSGSRDTNHAYNIARIVAQPPGDSLFKTQDHLAGATTNKPTESHDHSDSDSIIASVLRNTNQRRAAVLLLAMIITGVLSFILYGLHFIRSMMPMARTIEMLLSAFVTFHVLFSLYFLSAFKEVVRKAPNPSKSFLQSSTDNQLVTYEVDSSGEEQVRPSIPSAVAVYVSHHRSAIPNDGLSDSPWAVDAASNHKSFKFPPG